MVLQQVGDPAVFSRGQRSFQRTSVNSIAASPAAQLVIKTLLVGEGKTGFTPTDSKSRQYMNLVGSNPFFDGDVRIDQTLDDLDLE